MTDIVETVAEGEMRFRPLDISRFHVPQASCAEEPERHVLTTVVLVVVLIALAGVRGWFVIRSLSGRRR